MSFFLGKTGKNIVNLISAELAKKVEKVEVYTMTKPRIKFQAKQTLYQISHWTSTKTIHSSCV